MIIKSFVTLGLIYQVDNLFALDFPGPIKENMIELNMSKEAKIGPDNNTFR